MAIDSPTSGGNKHRRIATPKKIEKHHPTETVVNSMFVFDVIENQENKVIVPHRHTKYDSFRIAE